MAEIEVIEAIDSPLAVPDASMVGWCREFADAMSEHLESPKEFFYFCAMACLGHYLAKEITVESGLLVQPRLDVVCLGLSGSARKSAAIKTTLNAFNGFMSRSEFHHGITLHGIATDAGLMKSLDEQKRVLVVLDEMSLLSQKAGEKTSVLYQLMASLFDTTSYDHPTKRGPISLRGASLSLLAAATPESYETLFDPAALSLGFPNRLWIVPGETVPKYAIPPRVEPEQFESLRQGLLQILKSVKAARASHAQGEYTPALFFPVTPEANDLFQAWYVGRPADVAAGRLDTYGIRLALLTAVSQGKLTIDEEVMKAVIPLLDWQHRIRSLYAPSQATSPVGRLEEKIVKVLQANGGSMKVAGARGLRRTCHVERYGGLWAWQSALQNLSTVQDLKVSNGVATLAKVQA